MKIMKIETCEDCPYLLITSSDPIFRRRKIYFDCVYSEPDREIGEIAYSQFKKWKFQIPDWCPLEEEK